MDQIDKVRETTEQLLTLTADIISAHVESNKVATADLPGTIAAVYNTLAGLSEPIAPVVRVPKPSATAISWLEREGRSVP